MTLLEHGANPLITNSEEKTSSYLAKDDEVKMLLEGKPHED